MLEHLHEELTHFLIDAELDAITCPSCRVCVSQGRVCICPMRTKGPAVENLTRKTLTGELGAKATE